MGASVSRPQSVQMIPSKPKLFAKDAGEDRPVEPEPHFLQRGANGHSVVGHDLPHTGLDGGSERPQVLLEPAARVHLFTSVREVGILTILLRAAPGEVLRHCRNGLGTKLAALKTSDVRRAESADNIRVLAECLQPTCPAWLAENVDLWVKGDADAYCQILLPHDVAETLDQGLVAHRSESERLRPLGEDASTEGDREIICDGMTRVTGDRHRYPKPTRLREILDRVVPTDQLGRRRGHTEQVEMSHAKIDNLRPVGGEPVLVVGLGEPTVPAEHDHRLKHQTGLLSHSHLAEKQFHTLCDFKVGIQPGPTSIGPGHAPRRRRSVRPASASATAVPSCGGSDMERV